LKLHEQAETLRPADPATLTDHALCLLSSGRVEEAGKRYAKALQIAPGDQTALAGQYMVAIANGQASWAAELMDYRTLLGADSCTSDDQLDLAALREAVLAHPELLWEPAGRSTRKGQQSTMLDLSKGSPFEPFGRMLLRFVSQRMTELSKDASLHNHPWLLSRPVRWRLQSWATVLYQEGRQSPHIHPAGRMSGVFYLDPGEDSCEGSGAIIFGHLPDDVRVDATPCEFRIQPKAGQLLGFPSYFLHHTMPYKGAGRPRISLAFDVIPVPS
jgi:tetratricopeptide (TPR) repeat protein